MVDKDYHHRAKELDSGFNGYLGDGFDAEFDCDDRNADIIRALLLSGIRAAFLWRQLGGRRWSLLLRRKKLLQAAQSLSRGLGVV